MTEETWILCGERGRKFSVEPFSKGSRFPKAEPLGDLRRGRNPPIVQKRPRGECSIRKRMEQRGTTSGGPLLFRRIFF